MSATTKPAQLGQIIVREVTLSYPNLFIPRKIEEGKDAKFSATFILRKSSHKAEIDQVVATIRAVAQQQWGERATSVLQNLQANNRVALRDGSCKDVEGYGPEVVFFNASSANPPVVVDQARNPVDQARGHLFYPGCVVNAVVRFWAQDNADPKIGRRVNASIEAVQLVRDGDRIGGAAPVKAEEVFDVLEQPISGSDTSTEEVRLF